MRSVLSWICIVIFAIALPLSIVAAWAEATIFDQDTFVDTLAPLASDPDIQAAMSARLTAIASEQFAANGITSLAGGVPDRVISRAVDSVVQSAAFATVWTELLRISQPAFALVLEGNEDTANGVLISIDLDGPLDDLQSALESEGLPVRLFDNLAPEQKQVTILASDRLVQVHRATNFLHDAYAILPIVVLAAFFLAVAFATNRWRTLRRLGFGVVIGMAVLAVLLFGGRSIGLNQTANELQRGAAESIYDALTERLRTTIAAMFIGGLFLVGISVVVGTEA